MASERVWATPSGQTFLTRDGSTIRAWSAPSGDPRELHGEARTRVIEAWALELERELADFRSVARGRTM